MGFLETPITISFITMKVIWAFVEDYYDQSGPCLKSVACTNPELCKQMFATSEHEDYSTCRFTTNKIMKCETQTSQTAMVPFLC